MATALLVGAFGQHNPGDEALLAAFRAELADHRLLVATADPAGVAGPGAEAVDARDPRAVVAALTRADALVVGGGTVFKALHPASGRRPGSLLRRAVALATAARARGCRVALLGVGAAPLDAAHHRWLARQLVRRCDLLVLRDEESAQQLIAAGCPPPLRVGADAAWTQVPLTTDRTARTGSGVVVTVSHLAGGPDLRGWLAAALRPLAADGVPVALQPWQVLPGDAVDDAALATAVAADLDDGVAVLPPPTDLDDAVASLRGCRAVLGLRFHSLVAAGAAGRPFVAVAHEPKLAGLARRLGQPAVAPDDPPEAVADALRDALRRPGPAPAAIRRQVTEAVEGFHLLRLLLDGGRQPVTAHTPRLRLEGTPVTAHRVPGGRT